MDIRPIVYVDKSHALGGAEWNLCILSRLLDKSRFQPIVVADFPHLHHEAYMQNGAEVLWRSDGIKWWMGSDRWRRPLRGTDAIKRVVFARRLQNILRKRHAEILHVNLLLQDSWVDLQAAKRIGLKTVGNVHSLLSQRQIKCRCLDLCDVVICGSDCVMREIRPLTDASKVVRMYSPIFVADPVSSEEKCSARHALGVPLDAPVVSSVAMLDPRKGHDVAIQSIAKLSNEFPDLLLLIVGSSYDQRNNFELERLRKIAVDAGVENRVIFKGYISNLRTVYAASDIVFALSKDGEAFGRVTAEAGAHGRIVVSTAVGATPELVVDGSTGFLVPPNSVDAVCDVCHIILRDKKVAQLMGAAAVAHVAKNFDPMIITQQLESIYASLSG